jgi:hypothetical protein
MADLQELTMGLVIDMLTEKMNDGEEYEIVADQSDFDAF